MLEVRINHPPQRISHQRRSVLHHRVAIYFAFPNGTRNLDLDLISDAFFSSTFRRTPSWLVDFPRFTDASGCFFVRFDQ